MADGVERAVGFVGIGAMGWPMAANLVKAGHAVHVFDVRANEAQRFAEEVGGEAAPSLVALALRCDTVITMLPTSRIVAAVLFDAGGLVDGLRAGSLVIDMSSGVPTETAALAQRLKAQGVDLIDAPVSGGVRKAVSGELAIMVGGDAATLQRAEPILRALGATITHAGAVGCGQAMKALNNLVSAGGFLIGIEALLIGRRFGLDPAVMVDILNASTGMNNSTLNKFKQFVLSGSYASGFALDLMVKDIGIALDVAHDVGMQAPFSALCRRIWADAQADLGTGHDHTEVARYVAKAAGTGFD